MSVQTDETAREMFWLLKDLSRVDRFDALQALMERLRWDEENNEGPKTSDGKPL
jgi:hypothetical protein